MDLPAVLMPCLWSGLFATGLAVLFTAPAGSLAAAFACGFLGRAVRDLCAAAGMNLNWATVIAACAVVLVAVAITRRGRASPVVLICAVLPLGAVVAMFNLIFALVQVASAQGDALDATSTALSVNAGKVFATCLAIAVGLGLGIGIQRVLRRGEAASV